MTSIKVKFRPSTVVGKEGTIFYQIITNRMVRQLTSPYRIFPYEWSEAKSAIKVAAGGRGEILRSMQERINAEVDTLMQIALNWEINGIPFSPDDILAAYHNKQSGDYSFLKFMCGVVARLRQLGKFRTSETYTAAMHSFKRFLNGNDVMLDDIDSDLIESYEAYLSAEGISLNTISFYMRILRAVYNRAVEKAIVDQKHPFRHVYTGIEKTIKRAVPLKIIKKIKKMEMVNNPLMSFARDMFLFSFYTRGMAFIDMAYLRKKDLQNGILVYRRRKTGQQLCIKWERCMQEIVDRYAKDDAPYMLPLIRTSQNEWQQYKNSMSIINKRLKYISKTIKLNSPLSMYVARHSWASIARSNNIPISIISEGMGHDSEATTQIYLASLDNAVVDNANRKIINLV